tara:strand:+ start:72 stop:395 length:324 start_codon:yes stop_codon:yes gene_type:complete
MISPTAEDFVKEPKRERTYLQTDGTTAEEEGLNSCAYEISLDNSEQYYIKFFRSRLFDPKGADANKINSVQTDYRKVSKDTFDLYTEYLKTSKREMFLRAERKCLDG